MLSYDNKLFDKTIKTKDNVAGHVFLLCVCIRIAIGVLIVAGYLKKWQIIALCSLIIFVFSAKFRVVGNSTWKCYDKVIISYLSVLSLQFISKDKYVNQSAGFILMMDALLGLNSRCLVSKLSS